MHQHRGDLIVTDDVSVEGQVTGTTYVRDGGRLEAHGQLSGGLIIDQGGRATIFGQVSRNVINRGELLLYGQISGRVIGNRPLNPLQPMQIVGFDLEVPFRGEVSSWSTEESADGQN